MRPNYFCFLFESSCLAILFDKIIVEVGHRAVCCPEPASDVVELDMNDELLLLL